MTNPVYLSIVFLLCTVGPFAESVTYPQRAKTVAQPTLDQGSYRVTVDSVQKKADNYTVTLIFENLTDGPIKIKWFHASFLRGPGKEQPYLLDEKSNKYVLQAERFQGVLGDEVYGGAQVLAGTNLKVRYLFLEQAMGPPLN